MRICRLKAAKWRRDTMRGPGRERVARLWLVFKAHRLCVSLNSRLESKKEERRRRSPCRGESGREVRGGCVCVSRERQLACSSSQLKNYHSTEMCSGSEAGSYLRPIDSCITQAKTQGPSRTCNESKEEERRGRERGARQWRMCLARASAGLLTSRM